MKKCEDNEQKNQFITDFQLYLFNEGTNYKSYEFLGAHKDEVYGKMGYSFAVFAPNAKSVSVVGNFNDWDYTKNIMNPQKNSGVWHCFVEGLNSGEAYKYYIVTKNGDGIYKADPYAYKSEVRPLTASITADIDGYMWHDETYLKKREKNAPYKKPMLIYELHFGSWKRHEDNSEFSYKEMADELIPYIKEMGYTHIELMPMTEYPFDGSWGYQVTGYFSATSRYGNPTDFMYFIDMCHKEGIGVIMDWVPAHFPKDAHGLANFDGTTVFEYQDPIMGQHKEWGTLIFDYGKKEVISFLVSSAIFWLEKYHIDGIRADAVSSMLYLDYGRQEFKKNKYGGRENLEAIKFLQTLNTEVFKLFPNVLMIAEESTAWPMVTHSVDDGGLGFNYKWNMGWMNDMLKYMSTDALFRSGNHNLLTFSMMYAFSENYILPLSHDEVVHGKCSLIQKMSGLYGQKFDSLRAFYGYMMAHPGKKLLFMGGEFAQFIEWRFYEGLEWKLLEYDSHRMMQNYVKELNKFYVNNKAFWEIDDSWDGFEWINPEDSDRSIVSFIRKGKSNSEKIYVIANFTPVRYDDYIVGVYSSGEYEVVFSSDDKWFGGQGTQNENIKAQKGWQDGKKYSISINVPAMSCMYIRRKPQKRKGEGK